MLISLDNLPDELAKNAVKLKEVGMDGYAWSLDKTVDLLVYLSKNEKSIVLGGDLYLYLPKKGVIYPLLENWYHTPTGKNDHKESIQKALEFVKNFKDKPTAEDMIIDLVVEFNS
jgi:hypothetical protein